MSTIGFVLAVTAGLVAAELTALLSWLALRLVRWSARYLYANPERAAIRAEEWQAMLDRGPSLHLAKFAIALCFLTAALTTMPFRQLRRAPARLIPRAIREDPETFLVFGGLISGPFVAVLAGIVFGHPGFFGLMLAWYGGLIALNRWDARRPSEDRRPGLLPHHYR